MLNKPYYVIYTDGSCYKGRGGFGVYIELRTKETLISWSELSGGFENTTISRMELMAIVVGLEEIKGKERLPVLIVSDSQFIINSIRQKWVDRWESEKWLDRKNSDLWQVFLETWREFNAEKVKFRHTRGHGRGLECYRAGNDHADKLADYKSFVGRYEKDYSDEEWLELGKVSIEISEGSDLPF